MEGTADDIDDDVDVEAEAADDTFAAKRGGTGLVADEEEMEAEADNTRAGTEELLASLRGEGIATAAMPRAAAAVRGVGGDTGADEVAEAEEEAEEEIKEGREDEEEEGSEEEEDDAEDNEFKEPRARSFSRRLAASFRSFSFLAR